MFKRFLIFAVFLVLLDIYLLSNYKSYFTNTLFKNIFKWFYRVSMLISYISLGLILINFDNRPTKGDLLINLCFGYTFAFIVFRIVLALPFVFDDFIRLVQYLYKLTYNAFTSNKEMSPIEGRRKFIGQIGLGLASVPFLSMLYGITKGKYNYKVKNINLSFKNLPKAFNGVKIVHVSDIHSGSFDDIEEVKRGVELIKEQNPDLFLFTGDLINNKAEEIVPYKSLFKSINASMGKFSSLGNHDYGTHYRWKSKEDKQKNLEDLFVHQKEMGFQLLNNETFTITKDNENLEIVGVENWGKPPFPQKGDLDVALKNTEKDNFKILLSHDPTHWDEKVVPNQQHIDLTLSGHTHGMQFGVEIPGIKWSPSKYIYKRWAGLYKNEQQYLYVNRGFGFLGFPGRVGIWPEITVITLNKEA